MNIEILDPLNKISKSQKIKIKALYKEGKTVSDILYKVHYTDENFKYGDLEEEKVSENYIKLKFIVGDQKDPVSEREELRQKLKSKLQNRSTIRTATYKNDAWKMYYQVINHPTIKSLPDETNKKAIPNPDDVKKNADAYRMMNAVNPNPMLKEYFEECLKN
jgi:hypothetical protein